jgi:hypothetical protein
LYVRIGKNTPKHFRRCAPKIAYYGSNSYIFKPSIIRAHIRSFETKLKIKIFNNKKKTILASWEESPRELCLLCFFFRLFFFVFQFSILMIFFNLLMLHKFTRLYCWITQPEGPGPGAAGKKLWSFPFCCINFLFFDTMYCKNLQFW